jgi:glyoxylase-like metal-dependent hydrolase (beta-lactamase superfamily II)
MVAAGIASISVATPWPVGPVNLYVIDDDPLTLIDTGWRSEAALAELEAGLLALGHRVEDLQRIVITHQHIDHSGLARLLVERSGAELCALEPLVEWMETYPASMLAEDAFAESVLRGHGVGAAAARTGSHRGGVDYGERATVTRPLHDGDVLEFAGRSLRVLHRPGHSPYDTVLHDEAGGVLFGGDHVLNWPSTPIMAPPFGDDARNGRPRAFAHYVESLRATETLRVETILPGHGAAVDDHRATIAERMRRYERITGETAALVTTEPRSAAAIATELKGELSDSTAFFVLCEVLGHLDALIDAGAVEELGHPDGVARFVTA